MDDKRIQNRIRRTTVAVLPKELQVRVRPRKDPAVGLYDVTVSTGNKDHEFLAGWAGAGWPADVERLLRLAPKVQVAYAQRLSEGAKKSLESRHVGWIDEAGSANVFLRSGLILSRDAREMSENTRTPGDQWTRAMLAATEAILAGTPPRVEAVEESARISRGAAANSLARLERIGLLKTLGPSRGPNSYRDVVDLDRFVDSYANAAGSFRAKARVVRIHTLMGDPLKSIEHVVAPKLRKSKARWALSGVAASTLLAPYISDFNVVECYVDGDLFSDGARLAVSFDGRIVDRGHRIEVRELPTANSDHGPVVNGLNVALPARVYSDLLAAGGRSAEAARHLRDVLNVGIPAA